MEKDLEDEAKIVMPTMKSAMLGFIDRTINRAPRVPTGFNNLDKALDGGLEKGLYVIGAASSAGKTTFAVQMSDQMAEAGHEVMYFSMEMDEDSLIAKILSRRTYLKSETRAKSIAEIRSADTYADGGGVIAEALEECASNAAGRIRVIEGSTNAERIVETVGGFVQREGKKPVVIVDYMQYLSPVNRYWNDKQNTDHNICLLKALSQELELPVIAISSFNRQGYGRQAAMESFKESGGVEYCCEVLMALQMHGVGVKPFNAYSAKMRDPREIELAILKNRNGQCGTICFDYKAKYSCFTERKGAFDDDIEMRNTTGGRQANKGRREKEGQKRVAAQNRKAREDRSIR
jgi:replicative DNA helicase